MPEPGTHHKDPASISPLVACCLITLNKYPSVRPIVIGDTAQPKTKDVLFVVRPDT